MDGALDNMVPVATGLFIEGAVKIRSPHSKFDNHKIIIPSKVISLRIVNFPPLNPYSLFC